jgi:predicted metal-dependent phosphoesterase TrpH
MKLLKIDLHTHSLMSPDGSLRIRDYAEMLKNKKLDYIAITDHNRVDFAIEAFNQLGSRIIVGEEIMTKDGEIIGLFLKNSILPNQSLKDTINSIKLQQALVYLPHPFEKYRHGVSWQLLSSLIGLIDIVECYNGRTLNFGNILKNKKMIRKYHLVGAASSDSHGLIGFGRTYTLVKSNFIDRSNLIQILQTAQYHYRPAGLVARLYPTFNRYRK